MFDSDDEGKPFSRSDFSNIVVQGKYLKTVIAFGSKRDFDKPGFYIRNSMFPKQKEEMKVVTDPKIKTKRYVGTEGLFSRKEHLEEVDVSPWTLPEKDGIVIGTRVHCALSTASISFFQVKVFTISNDN